jgi:hypothetical protein
MQADRPLSPAPVRPGEPASGARHARPARTMRTHAIRGILVLALAFSTFALLAWAAHGGAHPGQHHGVVTSFKWPDPWMT